MLRLITLALIAASILPSDAHAIEATWNTYVCTYVYYDPQPSWIYVGVVADEEACEAAIAADRERRDAEQPGSSHTR